MRWPIIGAVLLACPPAVAKPQKSADSSIDSAYLAVLVGATNPSVEHAQPVAYDLDFAMAFQASFMVQSWLHAGGYVVRSRHDVQFAPGQDVSVDSDDLPPTLLSYAIGLRLEPGVQITSRMRTFALLGLGWGRMSVDRLTVSGESRSYAVEKRSGVFVETPMGLGISYQIIPSWLQLQGEFSYAPRFKQSGKLHGTSTIVDSEGSISGAPPWPTVQSMSSLLFGVSLIL